jgi:hypothetical protein
VKTRCTRAAEEASRAAQSAADKARSLADAEHSKAAAVKDAKIEKDRQKKQSKRDRERDTQVKREEENIARTKECVEAAAIVQARAHDIESAKATAERLRDYPRGGGTNIPRASSSVAIDGASGPSGSRLWRGKTGTYRQPLSVGRVICREPPVGSSVGRRENGFADRRASSFLVCGFTGRIREKQYNGKSPIPNQNQKAQNQT